MRTTYMPALDGLRGLAILVVMAHNAQLIEAPEMHGATLAAQYLLNIGWVGVQLFFVLSGFLITGILLDTMGKPKALSNFVVRRALRIFPLYYTALALIFVALPLLGMQPGIYQAEAPYQGWLWAYLVNWTAPLGYGPDALPHFWSLAVEEQFYLFWPLLVFALKGPAKVAWACLIVAVLSLVSRAWLLHSGSVPTEAVYSWTICRIDALALGGLAAACWRMPTCADWLKQHGTKLVAAAFVLFAMTGVWTHGYPRATPKGMIYGYSVLAILFAVIIYAAAWRDALVGQGAKSPIWHKALQFAPLRSIGKYSYGMYVIHKPLHDLFSKDVLNKLGIQPAGSILYASLHMVGIVAVTYVAAWLSYNLYETHFLKLKQRFA